MGFDVREGHSGDWPVVTILLDGSEFLSDTSRSEYMGFDPSEMLGDDSPLLPVVPPRRVAVYRCSCGEAGCGCAAPIVVERNGYVIWEDVRDYTGVYVGPTVDSEPSGGTSLQIADIVFDAYQYRQEVDRWADRSWESRSRVSSRILKRTLLINEPLLTERGYTLGWIAPRSNSTVRSRCAYGTRICVRSSSPSPHWREVPRNRPRTWLTLFSAILSPVDMRFTGGRLIDPSGDP
jgi:hypothetical protein